VLAETSTRPRLSAVSTLRISSARLRSPHPMAIQTLVFVSRSVTLVRTCSPQILLLFVQTLCPAGCQDASDIDILIYGQLLKSDHSSPSSSTSQDPPSVLQLRAARILTVPPLQQTRPPRPDDPRPRFPPTLMCAKKRRAEESPSTRLKRRKEEAVLQNARDVMTRIPSADAMGKAYRPKVLSEDQDDVFKVPPLPDLKGKGKAPDIAKELEKANKAVCHAPFLSFFPLIQSWLHTGGQACCE